MIFWHVPCIITGKKPHGWASGAPMRKYWLTAMAAGMLAVVPFAAQAKRINADVTTLNHWGDCTGASAACHPLVPVYTSTGGRRFVLVPRAPAHVDVPPTDVPEPGTLALLGLGLIGTFFARRRAI